MEKMFLTKSWEVRMQTTIFAILACNVFYGWTRVLGQGGELRRVCHDLGLALIQKGRKELADLRAPATTARGRPSCLERSMNPSQSTPTRPSRATAESLPSLSLRDSPLKHMLGLYSMNGRANGYQKRCIICGTHTSTFCVRCGQDCPIHPESTRKGGKFTCLARHRDEPSYRMPADSRKRIRNPED